MIIMNDELNDNIKISNIIATTDVNHIINDDSINLRKLYSFIFNNNIDDDSIEVEYDQNLDHKLKFRYTSDNNNTTTLMVFANLKINIMGSDNFKDINDSVEKLKNIIKKMGDNDV